jgi:hypothetical protein
VKNRKEAASEGFNNLMERLVSFFCNKMKLFSRVLRLTNWVLNEWLGTEILSVENLTEI